MLPDADWLAAKKKKWFCFQQELHNSVELQVCQCLACGRVRPGAEVFLHFQSSCAGINGRKSLSTQSLCADNVSGRRFLLTSTIRLCVSAGFKTCLQGRPRGGSLQRDEAGTRFHITHRHSTHTHFFFQCFFWDLLSWCNLCQESLTTWQVRIALLVSTSANSWRLCEFFFFF